MDLDCYQLWFEFSSPSGRAPADLNLDLLKEKGVVDFGRTIENLPYNSAHTITVPGAAAAWCDTVEQFGSGKVKLTEFSSCQRFLGNNIGFFCII